MRRLTWILLFLSSPAFCTTNIYVLASASGANNGTSWTDAFTAVPTAPARDSIVYVGPGYYGTVVFTTANSGTQTIEIRRATNADHGPASGWSNGFSTSAAQFNSVTFQTNYWILNGVYGGGYTTWTSSPTEAAFGFAFYFDESVCTPQTICCTTQIKPNFLNIGSQSNTVSHIIVKHVFFHNINVNSNCAPYSCYPTELANLANSNIGIDSVTISEIARDVWYGSDFIVSNLTNFTDTDNYYANSKVVATTDPLGYCDGNHGGHVSFSGNSSHITSSNNLFNNASESAMWECVNGTQSNDDIQIYGNLLLQAGKPVEAGNGCDFTNLVVYNNTFIAGQDSNNSGIYCNGCTGPLLLKNNLWVRNVSNTIAQYASDEDYNDASGNYRLQGHAECAGGWQSGCSINSDIAPGSTSGTHNNDLGNTSMFVNDTGNPLTGNYHLLIPGSAGITLSSPYNVDAYGVTRGANGTWERGAYQDPSSAPARHTTVTFR